MEQVVYGREVEHEPRPLLRSMWRGARARCPHCGEGRLFKGWLRPVDACSECAESYRAQRADDLPPYITIFIVGHVVVAGYMIGEDYLAWSSWGQLALWTPITLVMTLWMMRPVKGATIGMQWSRRMFGFGSDGDEHDPWHGEPTYEFEHRNER